MQNYHLGESSWEDPQDQNRQGMHLGIISRYDINLFSCLRLKISSAKQSYLEFLRELFSHMTIHRPEPLKQHLALANL